MATDAMNESWRRILTQIQATWADQDFQDSDLKKGRGNLKKIVELIHEATGDPKAEITQKIISFL
jgi:hypothetical protein